MDRINHASAEQDKFGAGKDGWTNGDPADPGSGTVPQEEWFDGVQEELVGIIEAAGYTPSDGDYTQLAAAIIAKISGIYRANASVEFVSMSQGASLLYDLDAPTDDRRVLFSFGPTSANTRVYWTGSSLEFTYNVTWSQGVGWVTTGGGNEGMIECHIGDTGGPQTLRLHTNLVSNAFTESIGIINTQLTPNPTEANIIYPVAVTKCLGRIAVDSGVVTVHTDALNINTAVISGNAIDLTWGTDFASANGAVIQVTGASTGLEHIYKAVATGAGTATVVAHDHDGTVINPAVTDMYFYIEAKGLQ